MNLRVPKSAIFGILLTVCSLVVAETARAETEGWIDRVCDTPQNLTGTVLVDWMAGIVTIPSPSVVWDGQAYGAAWANDDGTGAIRIWFARIAADGTVLVPPTPVTDGSEDALASIAWSGETYGIAFMSQRDADQEIYFSRVGADGSKIGADLRVTMSSGASQLPSLVWARDCWAVAWQDMIDGNPEIYFARLGRDGNKIGSNVRVSNAPSDSRDATLAWSETEYGVAWADARSGHFEIFFSRITADGFVLSENKLTATSSYCTFPSLVWNGLGWGLAWRDSVSGSGGGYRIDFVRLAPNGSMINSPVQVPTVSTVPTGPVLDWTGSEYGLIWTDGEYNGPAKDVWLARISAGGIPVGSSVQASFDGLPADSWPGRGLAFGTLGFGVVYGVENPASVRFVGVGCHIDSTPPSCPDGLTVASNAPSGVLLTWAPGIDPETEVAYSRVYRSGTEIGRTTQGSYLDSPHPAGPASYTVRTVNANGRESTGCAAVTASDLIPDCGTEVAPLTTVVDDAGGAGSAAWNGSESGVAWSDGTQLFFRRQALSGAHLGEPSLLPSGSQPADPAIAWNGSEWAILWREWSPAPAQLWWMRVSSEGQPLGTPMPITSFASDLLVGHSFLDWNGSEWGIFWTDRTLGAPEGWYLRLDRTGVPISPPLRLTPNDGADSVLGGVAWSGVKWGAAWTDGRHGSKEVYFGSFFPPTIPGDVAEAQVTTTPAGEVGSGAPTLSWDGSGFRLIWSRNRLNVANPDIETARFSLQTDPIDPIRPVASTISMGTTPKTIWTGSENLAFWQSETEIWSRSLDVSGFPIGSPVRRTSTPDWDEVSTLEWTSAGIAVFEWGIGSSGDAEIRYLLLGCGALDTTPPSCPASPEIVGRTATTLTLAWGPAAEADGHLSHYEIRRNGAWKANTTDPFWTDTSFDSAAGFVYWIDAVNAAGLRSPGCSAVDSADHEPPSCPSGVEVTGSSPTQISLAWLPSSDPASGLSLYEIFRNTAPVGTVSAAAPLAFTDGTVTPDTTYTYAVLARDLAGNLSTPCPAASTMATTKSILLRLQDLGTGVLRLDWTDVGLDRYRLFRSASPGGASLLAEPSAPLYLDSTAEAGAGVWFYSVR
jgi:hypothetical protein